MEQGRFWLLVADAARARIFVGSGPRDDLEEVHDFVSPQSRSKESALVSDRPGRHANQGSGHLSSQSHHVSADETHHKEQAADQFARSVADYLNHAEVEGQIDQLTVVAAPAFLGMLRDHLSAATSERVLEEIAKDLSMKPIKEIQAQLTRWAI